MHLALTEATALLVPADREPELDDMRAISDQHALELRGLTHKLGIFQVAAKAHDALYAGAVIPGAIEKHDLAVGRQMLYVALEIPLAALRFRRLFQGDDARAAGIQMLHEALDGAALARGIAPLEKDYHLLPGFLDPGLQLEQFNLQAVFLPLVIAALHQVLVGIAALPPVGRQFIIGIGGQLTGRHALLPEQALQQGGGFLDRHADQDVAHRRNFGLLGAVDRSSHGKTLDRWRRQHRRHIAARHRALLTAWRPLWLRLAGGRGIRFFPGNHALSIT